MFYTVETVYIQPASHPVFFNLLPSNPSIVYLQRPISAYAVAPPHILSRPIYQPKLLSNEQQVPVENSKTVVPQPSTPVSAEEQLDRNLSRLGYRRQFVSGDGNCFFTAVASQLIVFHQQDRAFRLAIRKRLNLPDALFQRQTPLARALRKLVCLEWKVNESKYKPYINDVNYSEEVRKFRADKFYSSTLGDILPLTMSNLIGIPMKIITNLSECPVIDICPQDEPRLGMKSRPTLLLAYNQENEGHYDIAVEKGL